MSFRSLASIAYCFVACGGSLATIPGGDAGLDAAADGPSLPPPVGQPPPAPAHGTPPANTTTTFVFNQIFLGEAGRDGTTSGNAWRSFGYNVDGKVTTRTSTDVCTLAPNAGSSVQVDGDNGIDNSWGSNLLPILQNAAGLTQPSKTLSDAIAKGGRTHELTILGLSSDPAQTTAGMAASLSASATYPGVPTFDLTTDWPVDSNEVVDGMTVASGAVHSFAAYVTSGTFVIDASGAGTFTWTLPLGGASVSLVIHHPILTFDHVAPGQAANGTIAGVLDTGEAIAAFKAAAGFISPSLCAPQTFDSIAAQISQSSDILADGTNSAGTTCNAISVGLGFSGVQIANPTMVAAAPTQPNPCP